MGRKKKPENRWVQPPAQKYALQLRYEHWTKEGKVFCDWFTKFSSDDEQYLKELMSKYLKNSVNPKMKIKEEMKVIVNPRWIEEHKEEIV